jgi:Bax protein
VIVFNLFRYHYLLYIPVLILCGCSGDKIYSVQTESVTVSSVKQIDPLQDSLVRPLLYTNVRGFDSLTLEEAKSRFVAVMLPAILVARHERETDQLKFKLMQEKDSWSREDSAFFQYLKERYQIKKVEHALHRMQTFPNSMVLAQAAVESGWGRSRFFVEAKNVFGIWSFSDKDVRVEARAVRGDKKVYLRAYHDVSGSVRDYFDVLSRSNAFRGLRIVRETSDDPFTLLPYLRNYSERKGKYTRLLKKIIEQNQLTRYDNYVIHPDYLVEE